LIFHTKVQMVLKYMSAWATTGM